MFVRAVQDRALPIPVAEFGAHIRRMHEDRDKLFETEFEVGVQYVNL